MSLGGGKITPSWELTYENIMYQSSHKPFHNRHTDRKSDLNYILCGIKYLAPDFRNNITHIEHTRNGCTNV